VDLAAPQAQVADRRPSALDVGVVVWLASELMFFSGLFAAWFTLRGNALQWPPAGVHLEVPRAAVFTLVLISSSATMHQAEKAAHREARRAALSWLALTATLGAIFLTNQALEYRQVNFRISSNAYGSIFFLLTGFHGLHVFGGLVFMGAVALGIGGSSSRMPAGPTLKACAYYWHFVDAVWVAVFSVVYLLS
jgi:cytochrome c oxidase subunit III